MDNGQLSMNEGLYREIATGINALAMTTKDEGAVKKLSTEFSTGKRDFSTEFSTSKYTLFKIGVTL